MTHYQVPELATLETSPEILKIATAAFALSSQPDFSRNEKLLWFNETWSIIIQDLPAIFTDLLIHSGLDYAAKQLLASAGNDRVYLANRNSFLKIVRKTLLDLLSSLSDELCIWTISLVARESITIEANLDHLYYSRLTPDPLTTMERRFVTMRDILLKENKTALTSLSREVIIINSAIQIVRFLKAWLADADTISGIEG